ncbi:MAG: hypothetical protein AAF127_03905 [Pseudomonadota bacterium]
MAALVADNSGVEVGGKDKGSIVAMLLGEECEEEAEAEAEAEAADTAQAEMRVPQQEPDPADAPDPRVYWPAQEQPAVRQDPSAIRQAASASARPSAVDLSSPQISTEPRGRLSPQITASSSSSGDMTQLDLGDIEGRLDQLSAAEQQVLLEAIEGSDLCEKDSVPEAIRKLCATRIETRSSEFKGPQQTPLSAEERLLGERLEETGRPNLARVIARLGQGSVSPDDFDNQAIASIALAGTPPPTGQPDDNSDENAGDLPLETQAIINAIVQQLSGPGGG